MAAIAGLLLMGGRSRRMGRDKAYLMWHGEVLWERQYRLLASVSSPVWRAVPFGEAPEPGRLVDAYPYPGPAPAIVRALHTVPEDWLMVLAVDLPRVDRALLVDLAARRRPGAVTIAAAGEVLQPLLSIWHRDTVAVLPDPEQCQGLSMRRLLAGVPWSAYRLPQGRWPCLANVNEPGDLDD